MAVGTTQNLLLISSCMLFSFVNIVQKYFNLTTKNPAPLPFFLVFIMNLHSVIFQHHVNRLPEARSIIKFQYDTHSDCSQARAYVPCRLNAIKLLNNFYKRLRTERCSEPR